MADKPKKPRRDLRARLGRTIAEKKGGAPAPAAPPNLGDAASPAAAPPPGGVAAPPTSVGAAGAPPGIAPPPGIGTPPAGPGATFAASAQPQEQVVRLEFDDELVSDKELGRGTASWIYVAAAAALVVGVGIGYAVGGLISRRGLYDRVVSDTRSISDSINGAAGDITGMQTKINAIVEAAAGQNEAPSVDYENIDALGAIEQPFDADDFTGRNYNALPPDVVHNLFQYLMSMQQMFQMVEQLRASTAANNREELNRAAAEAEGVQRYGALLHRDGDGRLVGSLGFFEIQGEGNDVQTLIRTRRGGQPRPFEVWAGQELEFEEQPTHFLIIDGPTSRGVLANQAGAFQRFRQQVGVLKVLTDGVVELQGDLIEGFGRVLSEIE